MNQQSDGNTNDPAITGELVVRRRVFLSRKIPLTVRAKYNGVKFTIYRRQYKSRYVPYQDLRSVSSREISGQWKIVLHADVGVETINCHSPEIKIVEFCNFVNDKIALTRKKPLAAKFALTRTEVPPEKNYTTWVYDEYGSAIDVLFNEEGSFDDLLEKLESEIASLTAKKEAPKDGLESPSPVIDHKRPDDDYPLFRNRHSFPDKIRPGRILLAGTAIAAVMFSFAWLADRWPIGPISPGSDLSLSKRPADDKAIETIPGEPVEEAASRALLHLITLMQDDIGYSQLIQRLKRKREALKIDSAELSTHMGWEITRLDTIEAQLIRASPLDIVKLSIHIDEDFHDIIGFEK